jgi:hypothetical protein
MLLALSSMSNAVIHPGLSGGCSIRLEDLQILFVQSYLARIVVAPFSNHSSISSYRDMSRWTSDVEDWSIAGRGAAEERGSFFEA